MRALRIAHFEKEAEEVKKKIAAAAASASTSTSTSTSTPSTSTSTSTPPSLSSSPSSSRQSRSLSTTSSPSHPIDSPHDHHRASLLRKSSTSALLRPVTSESDKILVSVACDMYLFNMMYQRGQKHMTHDT